MDYFVLKVAPVIWRIILYYLLINIIINIIALIILNSLSGNIASILGSVIGSFISASIVIVFILPTLLDEHTLTMTHSEIAGPKNGVLTRQRATIILSQIDKEKSLQVTWWQKLLGQRVIATSANTFIAITPFLYEKSALQDLLNRIGFQN